MTTAQQVRRGASSTWRYARDSVSWTGRMAALLGRRALWPTIAATANAPCWSRIGHRVVDRVLHPLVITVAVLLAALLWLLDAPLGLYLPSVFVFAFGLGRLIYPHTPRGVMRCRVDADGWATYWDVHKRLGAHAVRDVALTTRPTLRRTT